MARGQQAAIPVIGILNSGAADATYDRFLAGFRNGLIEAGVVEGQNATIDFRWAEGRYERLPSMATDLVRRNVAVIFAGGDNAARAAKAATATVPIVFTVGDDAVRLGLVQSLNRPGGNATGVNLMISEMEAKRLGLLHEIVPQASTIAVLLNPQDAGYETQLSEVKTAAYAIGQQLLVLNASDEKEIDTAFAAVSQQRIGALLIAAGPFFTIHRDQLIRLAARHAIRPSTMIGTWLPPVV